MAINYFTRIFVHCALICLFLINLRSTFSKRVPCSKQVDRIEAGGRCGSRCTVFKQVDGVEEFRATIVQWAREFESQEDRQVFLE